MRRSLLTISAVLFFCLHITTKLFAIGILASIPLLLLFAWKRPALADARKMPMAVQVFCALTAIGISLWPMDGFAQWLVSITVFQRLQAFLGIEMQMLSHIAAVCFAIGGVWFVFHMVCLFYERLLTVAKEILRDFSKIEAYTALAASAVFMAAVLAVYFKTDGFASPVVTRDLIYTADSGAIIHENAYLSLSALENDFRSPLFALFAAPLMGLPYLIGRLLPFDNAMAAVMAAAQIPLLVASFCMLMKMIQGVSRAARVLLPLLLLTTNSALLFTLMAEQYIVALFCLSLLLYRLLQHGKREQWLVLGAAGTMLTSAVAAFIPEKEQKKPGAVIKEGLLSGIWGAVMLTTLGCFGLVLRLPENLGFIFRYSGASVPIGEKLQQYFGFIGNTLIAPQASGIVMEGVYAKWRVLQPTHAALGIVLLALVCAGFVLNRRQAFARISVLWVAVSAIALGFIGWGAMENGMLLYTLYFGWAYLALLVYLVEWVCGKLRIRQYSWVLYVLGGAGMLAYTLPRIVEMVRFAIQYYPV